MKDRLFTLRTAVLLLFFIFLLILLLAKPQIAMDSVRRGLTLCTETLIPSLFPFLVLSELLIARHAGDLLGKFVGKPIAALLGLSHGGATALLLGGLCGFPVGTTTAVSLCEHGDISKEELHRLLLFANNPSSGFLVGAVGYAMFGSSKAGIALFCIVWISAIMVGVFLRIRYGATPKASNIPLNGVKNPPSVRDLTGSVSKGFSAMLQVLAFVLFFSCISGCLSAVLEELRLPTVLRTFLGGLPEMTAGISNAAVTLPPAVAFRLTAFFAGFAGLSVCLQLFSIAERYRPRLLPYLLAKLTQGVLSLGMAELYLRLFKPTLTTAGSITTFAVNKIQQTTTISILLLLPALLLLCSLLHQRQQRRDSPR